MRHRRSTGAWWTILLLTILFSTACAGGVSHANAAGSGTGPSGGSAANVPLPILVPGPTDAAASIGAIIPPTAVSTPTPSTPTTPIYLPPTPSPVPTMTPAPSYPTLPTNPPPPPADWSQWRYDASHSGANPNETIISGTNVASLHQIWSLQGMDNVLAVADGLLFDYQPQIAGSDGTFTWDLLALSATNGAIRWRMRPPAHKLLGDVVVEDGRVIFCGDDHFCYAVDEQDGHIVWSFDTGDNVARPVVSAGVVLLATPQRLYAVAATNGARLWIFTNPTHLCIPAASNCLADPANPFSTPSVANGMVFIGAWQGGSDNRLFALDLVSGNPQWSMITVPNLGTPVVSGTTILLTDGASIYAVDIPTGTVRWQWSAAGLAPQLPSVQGNMVYALATGTDTTHITIIALDIGTGALLWQTREPGYACGDISIAHGLLFFGCRDALLYALHSTDGGLAWWTHTTSANAVTVGNPVIIAGHIYVWSMTLDSASPTLFGAITAYAPSP